MKNIFNLLVLLFITTQIIAQTPSSFKYQAVIHDKNGELEKNQSLEFIIEILNSQNEIIFTEHHATTSNDFGLVNLNIGLGEDRSSELTDLAWGKNEMTVRIFMKQSKEPHFSEYGETKLLSVPYAIHSKTAENVFSGDYNDLENKPTALSEFINDEEFLKKSDLEGDSPIMKNQTQIDPDKFWQLGGNGNINPKLDKLGTRNNVDLILVTNGIDRVNIDQRGRVDIYNTTILGDSLKVQGPIDAYDNLYVGGNTVLNGELEVNGTSNLNKALNVNNGEPSNLSGTLDVQGETNIESVTNLNADLNVNNTSPSYMSGTLDVDGVATFNNGIVAKGLALDGPLNILNENPSTLTGTLLVEGETIIDNSATISGHVDLQSDLTVSGKSTFNDVTVFDINVEGLQTEQSSYPVIIKGSKQGLAIDLVPAENNPLKSHRGNNYISFWRDGEQKGRIEGMGRADLDPSGLVNMITSIIQNPPATFTDEGLSYNPFENLEFGTPPDIKDLIMFDIGKFPMLKGGSVGTLPTITYGCPVPNANCNVDHPRLGWDFSGGTTPKFPELKEGKLPSIKFADIETWTGFIPFDEITNQDNYSGYINIIEGFGDVEVNPQSPANTIWNFIKQGLETVYPNNQEDVTNINSQIFSNYTLDILTSGISAVNALYSFISSISSILDPGDILTEATDLVVEITNLIIYGGYADINLGVAYESGSGDYAEWLERANHEEFISPGDVVGVIGGKISKQFMDADQFMVISTAPLLLGNMPEDKMEEAVSEKVAFMGQVPVKVLGEVSIGDYILPSGCGDGLAIAVHPENMLAKDYQRIIGVAWEEDQADQLVSLINTAIGINNNDMAGVIDRMQYTLNNIQQSLAKLDPEFAMDIYETGSYVEKQTAARDMTVSSFYRDNDPFNGKTYSSKKEMLQDVKRVLKEEVRIDLDQYPLINYVFENPDKASETASIYGPILEDMKKTKSNMIKSMD